MGHQKALWGRIFESTDCLGYETGLRGVSSTGHRRQHQLVQCLPAYSHLAPHPVEWRTLRRKFSFRGRARELVQIETNRWCADGRRLGFLLQNHHRLSEGRLAL